MLVLCTAKPFQTPADLRLAGGVAVHFAANRTRTVSPEDEEDVLEPHFLLWAPPAIKPVYCLGFTTRSTAAQKSIWPPAGPTHFPR